LTASATAIRTEALKLLGEWRDLLTKHVAVSRQAIRKLLLGERFIFQQRQRGSDRWYELSVTPTLEKFFGAVPTLKKAVASPTGTVISECRPLAIEGYADLRVA
jgi:hypothetical protein